jgi:hypothetical protein
MTARLATLFLATFALCAIDAVAQSNVRIRGTITAVDATTISVKSRTGEDMKFALPDNVAVSVPKNVSFDEIKETDFLGVTSKKGPDGKLVAVEVHYLPPTAGSGHTPWDLAPDSTMTNANVGTIVKGAGARSLTLNYKDGSQTIAVPDGTPIVRSVPGVKADLVPGAYVFISAQVGADGKMSAGRIQVSKDGVRPPM